MEALYNNPQNFWPHPIVGIIGLFHLLTVDEIAICLF